jgi:hypothetical protein
MKKGDKATIYIPSSLGYGTAGREPGIKPNAILIFDMEIVDVNTEEQLMAKAQEENKRLEEKEKAIQDSLKHADAKK